MDNFAPFEFQFYDSIGRYYSGKIYPHRDKLINGYPSRFNVNLNGNYIGLIYLREDGFWISQMSDGEYIARMIGEYIIAYYG